MAKISPNRMRAIDHWVGVPLCFLLTILTAPFRRAWSRPTPRRVLFIELSEMGSTILADPAMRMAARLWGAELYFLIFAGNAASLSLLQTVPKDNVFTIREDSLATVTVDTLRFLVWARQRGIDTVFDLELFSRYTALLTALSGAANRIGFYRFHNEGLYRGELLTHRVAFNPHQHIAKNFIALILAAASQVEEVPYSKTHIGDEAVALTRARVAEDAAAAMKRRVAEVAPAFDPQRHRLVLINPNASDLLPQRRWPPAHFAKAMRTMLDRWPDVVILITGAPSDALLAGKLKAAVDDPRVVDFTGRTALAELPALYSISALMVTNDSGPGHFAAITELPTIVLFGPETPRLYGSLGNTRALTADLACSPCVSAANHRRTACNDPKCMAAITPEQVLGEVAAILDRVSLPA
jgi:ADP-heptose:LPS heptosyltransferase